MDMLMPYTSVKDLTEDQKKRLKSVAATGQKDGFTVIDGKVVKMSEVNELAPRASQRQVLFE